MEKTVINAATGQVTTVTLTPDQESAVRANWEAADGADKWRAVKILQTKAEAQKRIYAIVPQWKQNNLTARAVELMRKGNLTAEETAEFEAGLAVWDQVKAIRNASDLIEQDISNAANPKAFDINASARWP